MALIAALATAGILLIAVVVLVLAQRPSPDVMPAQEQAAGNQASNVGSDVTGERTLKFWIELLAIGKTFDSLIFEPPVSPAAAEKNFRSFSDAIRAGGQKIERLLSESTDVDPELVSITQQIRDQSIEVGDMNGT